MTRSGHRRPRASAYQIPSPTIGSPISSPVDIASAAQTRERNEPVGVEEPDAEEEERDRERHRMDRARPRSSRPTGRRGTPSASSARHALGAEVAPRRARRPGAPRATTTAICASASASGDGQSIQSGASSDEERIGVRAEPHDLLARRRRRVDLERAPVRPCSRPPAPCSRGRTARRRKSTNASRAMREEHGRPDDHRRPDAIAQARSAQRRRRVRADPCVRAASTRRELVMPPARRADRSEAPQRRARRDSDVRNASAIVSAAMAKRRGTSRTASDARSPASRPSRAGRTRRAPSRRLRERDDDEQQREVVQPHDRRERQRRGDREDERGALVAPRDRRTTTAASSADADARARAPAQPPTAGPGRARRCTACTSRHRRRPGAAAADPDSPRDPTKPITAHETTSSSPHRSHVASTAVHDPSRGGEPDDERPEEELRRERHADRRPSSRTRASRKSPGERGRKAEHERHVARSGCVPRSRAATGRRRRSSASRAHRARRESRRQRR